MELMRWDPFRTLRRRDDAFDDLFREFFRPGDGGPMAPAAEVAEIEEETLGLKYGLRGIVFRRYKDYLFAFALLLVFYRLPDLGVRPPE